LIPIRGGGENRVRLAWFVLETWGREQTKGEKKKKKEEGLKKSRKGREKKRVVRQKRFAHARGASKGKGREAIAVLFPISRANRGLWKGTGT